MCVTAEDTTIGEFIDLIVEDYPDNDALVYPDRGLRYSYRELREICNQFSKGLLKLGIKKNDHLALWATNVPEWVITQIGSARIGAVLVTVNTTYKLCELEYQLKHSDVTTLVLIEGTKNSDFRELIYEICPELQSCKPGELKSTRLPLLKNVIMIGKNRCPGMFTWDEVLAAGADISDKALTTRSSDLDPDDVALIIYTSGTTGMSKGVMLTHRNVIVSARMHVDRLNINPSDRMCITMPFFHSFGAVASNLCCMAAGATMVPVETFAPLQVLQAIEKENCTVLNGVPTMFIMELGLLEKEKHDVSSLRTGIAAGACCPPDVMNKLVNVMNMREIVSSYGQTEATSGITITKTDDPIELKMYTVGEAVSGVEVKIVDVRTGEKMSQGKPGEIYVRGDNVMKGYYKMPEATAEAIDGEGWLHTGDMGIMDDTGYYKLICRRKDMIIRGGENIYPKEIEDFLSSHPLIEAAQIVGVPSYKYGEEVMVFVKAKKGQILTSELVRDFCRGKIANNKIPHYVAFIEEFPYTASGKVQKFMLRKKAIEMLNLPEDKA